MLNVPVTRTSLVDAYIELDPYNAARAECVEIGVGMPRAIWSTQFQTIRNEMVQKVLFAEATPPPRSLKPKKSWKRKSNSCKFQSVTHWPGRNRVPAPSFAFPILSHQKRAGFPPLLPRQSNKEGFA